jgi:hypothetical protein
MTAAALVRAAGSTTAAYIPPSPCPQGTRPPREHHDPIATDRVVWFAVAVSAAQVRHLAAHFRARRL